MNMPPILPVSSPVPTCTTRCIDVASFAKLFVVCIPAGWPYSFDGDVCVGSRRLSLSPSLLFLLLFRILLCGARQSESGSGDDVRQAIRSTCHDFVHIVEGGGALYPWS